MRSDGIDEERLSWCGFIAEHVGFWVIPMGGRWGRS